MTKEVPEEGMCWLRVLRGKKWKLITNVAVVADIAWSFSHEHQFNYLHNRTATTEQIKTDEVIIINEIRMS